MKHLRINLEEQLAVRREIADDLDRLASSGLPSSTFSEIAQRLMDLDSSAKPGDDRYALSEALRSLKMAADWQSAVETADPSASAYRDASRQIAKSALRTNRNGPWSDGVVHALEFLEHLSDMSEVSMAADALQRAPLLFPTTDLRVLRPRVTRQEPVPEPTLPPTAHLHFTLNDEPVSWPMALQAGVSYRFGASATVTDWSEAIEKIQVEWKCAAPESILQRTSFSIMPDGRTSGTGYLHARAEIPPGQAVDLTPVVTIQGASGNKHSARIVGQRSLRIATFAPSEIGAGLPMLSQRIVELLAELDTKIPTLPRPDRLNLLHLLDANSRFAALAIENKMLITVDEKGFQKELKEAFVMYPRIGRRIQEGSELGGGETDLVLERIVNELKVSPTRVDFENALRFIGQPTQYASAGDCPISVLTVLDQSEKTEPPGIQSNYMKWLFPRTHTTGSVRTPSMVAVVIIPVGFPVPSHWSRSSHGQR